MENDDEQLSMVVTSVSDGSIVGIYGGRNQNGVQELNRATSKSYQPGSSAKPILDYGPAIEYNNASPGTYVLMNQCLTQMDNLLKTGMVHIMVKLLCVMP